MLVATAVAVPCAQIEEDSGAPLKLWWFLMCLFTVAIFG
eukprot:gene3331-7810_t